MQVFDEEIQRHRFFAEIQIAPSRRDRVLARRVLPRPRFPPASALAAMGRQHAKIGPPRRNASASWRDRPAKIAVIGGHQPGHLHARALPNSPAAAISVCGAQTRPGRSLACPPRPGANAMMAATSFGSRSPAPAPPGAGRMADHDHALRADEGLLAQRPAAAAISSP